MQEIINSLFNLILVTIPEQLFLVVMTLILLKKFGILDILMWKQNIKWILIPAIPISIIEDINAFFLSSPIITFINLIFFYILMVYILRNNNDGNFTKNDHKRLFLNFGLSFLILGVLESITVPLMLILLDKSLTFINDNVLWNFIASIPSRVFELLIVSFLIIKNNNVVKIKLLDFITKSNFHLISIVTFIIMSNIFAVYAIRWVGEYKILENKVSILGQIITSMSILIVPAIMLFWVLVIIHIGLTREERIQQVYENLATQDDIDLDVE